MKLSEYGTRNGIKYRAGWNRFYAGKIKCAYPRDESGHVVVPDPIHALVGKAAIYARVSTHKQKDDLERQAERMVAFANAAGLSVVRKIATGVNDTRLKLTALLKDDS